MGETEQGAPSPAPDAESEALLRPISPDQPTGDDPKLTDDFDRAFGEIGKLEGVGGADPDWALVYETSAKILGTVGKDLRCLGWWVHARFRLQGVSGLEQGLAALAASTAAFAEGLHPKRDKARAAALDWLGTRLEADLPLHLKSAPAEKLEAMRKSLDAVQEALKEACASFEGLHRARAALKGVKAEVPKPVAAAKPAAPAVAARPAGPAASPPPAAPTVPEHLTDLVEHMMDRAASEGDTVFGLRLRRQALWLGMPEALAGGKKFGCDSIQPKVRMELEQMFNGKRWAELLERTESLFRDHPFCLDLTFYAAHAAGELVDPTARDALAGELVALVIRNPKLPRATDRTGQPLASAPTRAFIGQLMAPKSEGAPAPAPVAVAAPADGAPAAAAASLDALPPAVEALLTEKKVAEAVRLASAATMGLSGRVAFGRHLVLAERLEQAGSAALAFSLFRALVVQLRTASLSQWEPALEARCIRGYLQGARAAKQTVEGERELLDALMLLDPGAAVGLV
jgi:type VI secretion system protein VasJ